MCGIFFLQSKNVDNVHPDGMNGVYKNFHKLKARGPDRSELRVYDDCILGFQRLAVNGLNHRGDQPFCALGSDKRVLLVVNGEIYNYKQLIKRHKLLVSGSSDCEVILHLYLRFGMVKTLEMLDGVFAFVLKDKNNVFCARDPIGVRPLLYQRTLDELACASTAGSLEGFGLSNTKQVPPGSFYHFDSDSGLFDLVKWYKVPNPVKQPTDVNVIGKINNLLTRATSKRLLTDRPFGCLLSGGLDSSLVTSILVKILKKSGQKLKTFSIGFDKNATDLIAARKVSKFLDTDHQEIIITQDEAFASIPEVIETIESYDITTVRASVGMYLIGKWIKQNTDVTVLFSGEGADETFCGYLYLHYAPNLQELEKESRRLVEELPYFDVLRADRSISQNGLELRVPFLDKDLINYVMSLPGDYRSSQGVMEKHLLREAFANNYLPNEVLRRRKEGFSDGVGSTSNPWYLKIQQLLENQVTEDEMKLAEEAGLPQPITKESVFYFNTYHSMFKNTEPPIPHHWMPKWQQTNDPSGRVMPVFDE